MAAIALGLAVVGPAALGMPSPARAAEPVEFGTGDIVDEVGALDGREADVQAALDTLYDDTGVQLFVAFVDDFDGTVPVDESWAIATAELNRLGTDDVLLAVAIEESSYDIRYPDDFPLTVDQTDEVERTFLPLLGQGRWADAVIEAADGYRTQSTGATDGSNTAGSLLTTVLVVLAVIAVLAVVVVVVLRRRRQNATEAPPDRVDQAELDRRVGSLLVQLDDSVRTSEEELGFAVAQFGDEVTRPFADAVTDAKKQVGEAFRLKQRLDDAQPDTPEEKRAVSLRIIELCESADARLDEQADAFDELRALEQNLVPALDEVTRDIAETAPRIAAADAAVDALRTRYSAGAIAAVADNVLQAEELLRFARASADTAGASSASSPSRAAVAVRAARASLTQILDLLTAIHELERTLDDAERALEAATADIGQDLAAARALPHAGSSAVIDPAVAAAEAALAPTEDDRADPVARLERIARADDALEQVLTSARDEQARRDHERRLLEGTLATARSQLDAAARFISTRRGAISDIPRTRLAEAARHLDVALSLRPTDPAGALSEARQASSLAESALFDAQNEVSTFQSPYRGGLGGGGAADLGGLLTGLVIGSLSGSGGRGGYSSGGFGGFGGGFGGGPVRRSSGFGGSSRSSRGGFGGGGRRGGGGRSSRGRF